MSTDHRILLVEDDRELSGLLAGLLAGEGYDVDAAFDGQAGLHLALTREYDAFVFDRGLPVLEGVALLSTLRARGNTTPALLLTARGALADRVEGLDAGAEDYLVKPFEIPELLARIRSLLRRGGATATSKVGPWEVDRVQRTATHADSGERVALSDRESDLIALLCASPTQVFSREQLLRHVFDKADTPGAVDTYVHYLRRKLGRGVIATVRGLGYRLGS